MLVRPGAHPSLTRRSQVVAFVQVQLRSSRARNAFDRLLGSGTGVGTGAVTTVVVGGAVVVTVVVDVVVPPEPVFTVTPDPQCQPPLVLPVEQVLQTDDRGLREPTDLSDREQHARHERLPVN